MCLAKDESPQKEAVSPRSPWAKLLNRQNAKPRLPRKVASSTRVNLNKCWSKLGELISNSSLRSDLPSQKTVYPEEPLLLPFSEYFYPLEPVKPAPLGDNYNVDRQNLLNIRFELISENIEENDNIINEVKEICYISRKDECNVCKDF